MNFLGYRGNKVKVSVIIELVRELVTSNMLCQRQRRLTSITMLKSPPF